MPPRGGEKMTKSKTCESINFQEQQLEIKMIRKETHSLIKELFNYGMSKKAIARTLGIDPKTVRRHIQKEDWEAYKRPSLSQTLLKPHIDWLCKRMPEVDYNARVLQRELCDQGYEGSYETVKKFVSPFRLRHLKKVTLRFETAPGKQSQVDWGSSWVWINHQRVKVHIFGFVLGYSRRLFGRAYRSEQLEDLIHGHERAFEWFGGCPEEILYDNPRTMVCSHNLETRQVILNSRFKDFVSYYGFQARFCFPYRPQTKGKIESGVKYIKGNFLKGRHFESFSHLNEELSKWCLEVADQRIHGTTREKPCERFMKENLRPLGRLNPYTFHPAISRKVSIESRVRLNTNEYSVPFKYAGQCVDLKVKGEKLEILQKGNVIARHCLLKGRYEHSLKKEHYEGLLQYQKSLKAQQDSLPCHDPYWIDSKEVEVRDLRLYEEASTFNSEEGGEQHAF